MRVHVINELINLAKEDDRINLLVGDLGFNVVEKFAEQFPNRFFNCGIAEENMMSVAAGMALEGAIPFVYSIGNFPTLRCLEQIRNDVCYHHANVNIISVGGGFSYGSLGMTHHTTEELGVLRCLPEMHVYAPADHYEAVEVLRKVLRDDSPSYIRLARGADKEIHNGPITSIENLVPYNNFIDNNYDVTLISTGTVLDEVVFSAKILEQKGLIVRVFSCPSIKPIDTDGIKKIASSSKYIATVEEHNIIGGLGSAVSEIVSSMESHSPLIRFGLNDVYSSEVGSTEYLRKIHGIDAESIARELLKKVK